MLVEYRTGLCLTQLVERRHSIPLENYLGKSKFPRSVDRELPEGHHPSWAPSPPYPWYLAQDPRHQGTWECLRETENSLESKSHVPVTGSLCSYRPGTHRPPLALRTAPMGLRPLWACLQLSPPGSSDAGPEVLGSAGQRADSQSQLLHPPARVPHTHRHDRQMPLKTRSESGALCQLQLEGAAGEAMQISTESK